MIRKPKPSSYFVTGTYEGGGCFFDYGGRLGISLYFVKKQNRPKTLKLGALYRLKGEGIKYPVYTVEGEVVKE